MFAAIAVPGHIEPFISESWPGLSRPSTSFWLKARKKTWMPATSAGMTLER